MKQKTTLEKLTKQQERGICKLLHHTHSKEMTQHILNTIGKVNWTRDIFSECSYDYMTEEQEDLFESVEVVIAGKEKKDRILGTEEKKMVAYHEVGHALLAKLLKIYYILS